MTTGVFRRISGKSIQMCLDVTVSCIFCSHVNRHFSTQTSGSPKGFNDNCFSCPIIQKVPK